MALDIDGFAVLRSITAHKGAFPDIVAEAAKVARALVVIQLKTKKTELKSVRGIRTAVGAEPFNLILDGMTESEIKSLFLKIDRHCLEPDASKAAWRLRHVRALADGSAEPAKKTKAPPEQHPKGKKPAEERPIIPERLSYSSAGAKRKR